jgi:DNA-binding XRE family transcriptional regulator
MNASFSRNLKRLMLEHRVLVLDVAAACQVSDVCVRHWRNGRWLPKLPQALALARLFGTTVEALCR